MHPSGALSPALLKGMKSHLLPDGPLSDKANPSHVLKGSPDHLVY